MPRPKNNNKKAKNANADLNQKGGQAYRDTPRNLRMEENYESDVVFESPQMRREFENTQGLITQKFPHYLIQLLPKFSADKGENIEDFFSQVENIFRIENNMSSQIKGILLKARLEKQAADFCLHDPFIKNSNDYNEIKEALFQRFKRREAGLKTQEEFDNITHKPSMSVQDLVQEIREKANKLGGDMTGSAEIQKYLQKLMLNKFMQAIREDIKVELLKENVTEFYQAIDRALILETVFDSVNNAKKSENVADLMAQLEICKITEEIKQLKQQQNSNIVTRCQICQKTNHEANTCFYRNSNIHTQQYNYPAHTQNFNQGGYRHNTQNFHGQRIYDNTFRGPRRDGQIDRGISRPLRRGNMRQGNNDVHNGNLN